MTRNSFKVCKTLSEELDTEKLHRKFLASLLDLQNVERGSLWVKRAEGYQCIEALGSQSDRIKGITIPLERPSVVGWVIENGKMTVAEPGMDKRHYKEAEDELEIKSRLILCLPCCSKAARSTAPLKSSIPAPGESVSTSRRNISIFCRMSSMLVPSP